MGSKINPQPAVPDDAAKSVYKQEPGPEKKSRRCHDVFFALLFVLVWAGMIVIAVIAFQKGDLNRLKYGSDSFNNLCGTFNPSVGNVSAFNATAMPYVHFLNAGMTSNPLKRCIDTCPKAGDVVCQYNATLSTDATAAAAQMANGTCFPVLFTTKNLLYRCMPVDALSLVLNNTSTNSTMINVAKFVANDLNGRQFATQMTDALTDSWRIILGMAGLALGLSFVWLFLVNMFAGFVVWLTVLLANVSFGGITGFLWYNWYQVKTSGNVLTTGNALIDSQAQNLNTLMVLGIIFAVVFLIVFLMSVAGRSRIKLAIVVIKETSRALRTTPMLFFLPIVKNIVAAGLFAFFTVVYALLSSSGNVIAQEASADIAATIQNPQVVRYTTPDRILPYLQIYFVFGFLWAWNFLIGIWQTTIAGSIASWYWCRDKKTLPRFRVVKAFLRCFRYHLGSIALGSLLIAIVQLIRYLLAKAQRQLKAANNKMATYVLSCMQCCFWCLEKFMKFINKNAYIEVAVYGYSFCEGARQAFQLLLRNAFRVVILDSIGNFLLFLGKLLIVSVTCIVGLFLLQRDHGDVGSFYAVPLIFIFVICWVISSFFMSVVDMAIDTIFLCFCEDCERNDGTAAKPYYMTNELRAFTDAHKNDKPDIAKG